MKVLHINSYYSKSYFYKNLYDKQVQNGININVFVPVDYSFNCSSFDYGSYTQLSMNFSNLDRFFFFSKQMKIFKDMIKKHNIIDYDIIHAHSLFTNGYVALKAKRSFNVPYIVAVRNTDLNLFFKIPFIKKLGLEILKEANRVVFLSKPYQQKVIERLVPNCLRDEISNKSSVLPNGIEVFWLGNKGIPKTLIDRKKLKLIYAGVINKNKNIIATLRAIEILSKKGYNIEFSAVGRVDDSNIFKELSKSSFFKFYSQKAKEELINIYRNNDIFIMPSRTETFGLVYAEALSQGLPIVYTRGQGFDGQFDDGVVGYSVNPDNYNEIADAILRIADNYSELSKRAVDLSNRFEWSGIAKQYIQLYGEMKYENR